MIFPLVGNEKLKETLFLAIKQSRVPHAILIEGDKGLGRHTLMRFIAKAVLCEKEGDICGQCRSCTLFESGNHPDFRMVSPEDGKKSVTVEKVRSVRADAFVKPHISSKKVLVFDMCDGMNEQSQNALLKVLEEPPRGVVFILIAESKTSLLDTIISRCAVLTVSAPPLEEAIKAVVSKINVSENAAREELLKHSVNIGAVVSAFSEENRDLISEKADEFLEYLIKGDRMAQMKLLYKFEKDRTGTDRLFSLLKRKTVSLIRENRQNTAKARTLNRFYTLLAEYEPLLKTNVNLPLLFTALVCKQTEN